MPCKRDGSPREVPAGNVQKCVGEYFWLISDYSLANCGSADRLAIRLFRSPTLPDHRIFIALDISDRARGVAANHINDLRSQFPNARVGWARPEKLHITVKFLGDTDDRTVTRLISRLAECSGSHPPLDLRLATPGVFSSRSNPRVLWIGMGGDGDGIAAIRRDIETVCEEIGVERDKRTFRPHLTIGRVRHGGADPALIDRHVRAQIEPVEFKVTAIAVYESRLQPTGSVYSVLARIELGTQ